MFNSALSSLFIRCDNGLNHTDMFSSPNFSGYDISHVNWLAFFVFDFRHFCKNGSNWGCTRRFLMTSPLHHPLITKSIILTPFGTDLYTAKLWKNECGSSGWSSVIYCKSVESRFSLDDSNQHRKHTIPRRRTLQFRAPMNDSFPPAHPVSTIFEGEDPIILLYNLLFKYPQAIFSILTGEFTSPSVSRHRCRPVCPRKL